MTANIIISLCWIIIMIMSSEDEDLNRGEAVAQEQQRITEEGKR